MPRSIKRRLELLERRPPPKSRQKGPERLIALFEGMNRDGHVLTTTAEWQAAWLTYMSARERVAADPGPVPADYYPDLPEADRRRLWDWWGDKRLDDPVSRLLEIYLEAADAALVGPGH